MKIAVLKLGSRISFNSNDTSGGNGEARSIIKMLHIGGAEAHIYTKILHKKDILPEEYKWHNLSDQFQLTLPGIDALVVLNGNVNFYGGVEDYEQCLNYAIINSFKGKIFYILCDPELTLKQIWPSVSKKEWSQHWSKGTLNISRKDITYICQPFNTELVLNSLKNNEIIPNKIIHFPFERFPCLNERLPICENPEVDLSYGGTMRGGKRIKKMLKFYFGYPDDINVEMFGKIQSKDFRDNLKAGLSEPKFTGTVQFDKMLNKMNKSLSHVVIGDPWYEKINDIPQRTFESIQSSVVTFIDKDMDLNRRVYGLDKYLSDFCYVQDRNDVIDKIRILKKESQLRKEIIESQFKTIQFNSFDYCKSFTQLIQEFL